MFSTLTHTYPLSPSLCLSTCIYRVLSFKYEQRRLTTAIYSVVKTKLGNVKGVKRNTIWGGSYYSFEKIPFAKPPLGELRFRAPEPAEPWERELDCTSPGEKPLQTHPFFRKFAGSEDCLYLNVYAKDVSNCSRQLLVSNHLLLLFIRV